MSDLSLMTREELYQEVLRLRSHIAEWRDLAAIAEVIPAIKAGYAEGTGGQDLPFILAEVAKHVTGVAGAERERIAALIEARGKNNVGRVHPVDLALAHAVRSGATS